VPSAPFGGDAATLGAIATFLVVVVVAGVVMPGVSEVPATFPATTLWSFRLASLGTQMVMWATIGVVFAVIVFLIGLISEQITNLTYKRDG